MTTFSADISLNISRWCLAFSIFPILCTSAPSALDCSVVCRLLSFPQIFFQDFATVRAIDYFLIHAFHLLPIFALEASPKKKKKGEKKKHGSLHPKRCDKCLPNSGQIDRWEKVLNTHS